MNAKLLALVVMTVTLVSAIVFLPSIAAPPAVHAYVSYNNDAANKYHAPLSGMGADAEDKIPVQQPIADQLVNPLSGNWNGSAESAGGAADPSSALPSNTVRFINDGSYMPQSETTLAVDPNNPSHVVGGVNDARYFICPILSASDCPSGWTFSLSGFMVSTDGGRTVLKTNDLPGLLVTESNPEFNPTAPENQSLLVSFGDPAMQISPTDGQVFYSTLAIDPVTRVSGIEVAKSNSGLWDPNNPCVTSQATPWVNSCWTTKFVFGNLAVGANTLEDKDTAAVDANPSSPYYGDVYIAWDHFTTTESSSYIARCTNDLKDCEMISGGGQPVVSGSDMLAAFTTPVVDKSGNVHVTWCDYGTPTTFGPIACRISSSPPGGEHFGTPTNILSFMGAGTTFPSYNFTMGFATEQFRTASSPAIAVDPTSRSTNGNIYFAIQLCTTRGYDATPNLRAYWTGTTSPDNPGNCGGSSIAFTKSGDGGKTWSTPVLFEPPQSQNGLLRGSVNAQPWVSVDPSNGNVYVSYYTTKFDSFDHRIDVVSQKSNDGGDTFSQIRVTSVSNEPDVDPEMYGYFATSGFGGSFVVPQYGDYFTVVALNGRLYELYTGNYAQAEGTFQTDPFLTTRQG